LAPLQQNLATTYKTIATVYGSSDVHSGSSASISNVVKDIYAIANSVSAATATTDNELNAQRLADRIMAVIGYYFKTSDSSFAFNSLGDATNESDPVYHLVTNTSYDATDFTSESGAFGLVTSNYLKGFPVIFNLPDGVSQLAFTAFDDSNNNGFYYKSVANSQSLIDISSTLDATKYMYPSELLYFDNSLLRVNDADKDPADYPNGYNTWDTGGDADLWDGWTIGPVASTTRSVAVKNNINYGVAMLKTSVALAENVTAFKDNRPEDEHVTLSEDDIKGFTLTGVLIGGQYKQLGWNFIADPNAVNNNNFVVFDNKIANGSVPSSLSSYTLLFDNYATGDTQSDVRVALEFKNGNDKDIYGIGGMIPKGGTFYLVGKLQLSTVSGQSITWPTTYAIPPYNANGQSTETKRIFIQDYVTTATFTIGEESLKNAYTTVPDLRSSQTSLGLSVDLNWRPGLSFETVLGE
jgi:hypothetical protein